MGYIKYKDKKYKTVTIRLTKSTEFSSLLKEFHQIYFTGLDKKMEHIRYAVLELVNNSIRAHQERDEQAPITLQFILSDQDLLIIMKDRGGGFDTGRLPYDISEPVDHIDLNNPDFQAYRERHGYHRFGMGLLVAKRTFDDFVLKFHARGKEELSWTEGRTEGTILEMRSTISHE